MSLKLTIDIFSGRPNPVLIVEDKDVKKVLDAINLSGKTKAMSSKSVQPPSGLGYRGIKIEQLTKTSKSHPKTMNVTHQHMFADGNFSELNGEVLEEFVFSKLSRFKDVPSRNEFKNYLDKEVRRFKKAGPVIAPIPIFPIINPCYCAPDPDLAWWNDGSTIQSSNNCYNYASNYRTNTFAQPGKSAGLQYTSLSGCNVAAGQRSAKMGAVADQLIDLPLANNKCPGKGHLVALVIAPGFDFHWFRKGPNGMWSHKPGGTAARLLDNSGNPISDPRTANRGPYTQFCTFMQVLHGHIKIG